MSILINGMKMPTSCWDCYFQDCGNCRLNAHKVVDKCIIEDRRDDDCPFVPVPPHGRLIDANEYIKDQCNSCDGWCNDCDCDCLNCASDHRCDFIIGLANAPTIIPAEEG